MSRGKRGSGKSGAAGELQFVALGGSGEIGMNANLYGYGGKWIMVDLGVSFGSADYPGAEVIMPDIAFIEEHLDDLLGIVLTHGHEDHIGALPYLAGDLGVPLYANAFTADLIAAKLEEEGIARHVKLNRVDGDGSFAIGPFDLQLVQLAHSIPAMSAVVITTPAGRVFHSGDWKIDNDPKLGRPAAGAAVKAIGAGGVDVLVCDSTNVFNPEPAGSEGSVRAGLLGAVSAAKGRVVVTSFASNVARLVTLGDVAKEAGRSLCVAGRSLDRFLDLAAKHRMLKGFPPLVDFDAAMRLPPHKLMVICTGGQGETRAALSRIATGSHQLKLDAGDTVIFSSRQIPGNELAIGRIMNQLAAQDILTVTEKQAHIHVSGHPGQPELAELYGWLKPALVVPVHGEIRHMREQARFARRCGVPDALVQTNGDVVRLLPGPAKKIGAVTHGRLVLDGNVIIPAEGETINDRRKLAQDGYIALAIGPGAPADAAIEVSFRGVPVIDDRGAFVGELADAARKVLAGRDGQSGGGGRRGGKARGGNGNGSGGDMNDKLRLAVRQVATRWTGKKPVVDIMLLGR